MLRYEQLLLENKAWAQEIKEADPQFFERLSQPQKPEILWIGCSDSRVSPNEITQCKPGQIFTHRNIANLVLHTDLNLFSVAQYAIEVLGITDIVVCGHYDCGGVKGALTQTSLGTIDKWLRHIKDVYSLHKMEIDALPEDQRVNRLIERNVEEQILNLVKTPLIQGAWKKNKLPYLHGWVFDLPEGIIKPIIEIKPGDYPIDPVYQYNNLD